MISKPIDKPIENGSPLAKSKPMTTTKNGISKDTKISIGLLLAICVICIAPIIGLYVKVETLSAQMLIQGEQIKEMIGEVKEINDKKVSHREFELMKENTNLKLKLAGLNIDK